MTTKRTTHRSTANRKLYAVRGKDGRFKDVQTYKRAHRRDLATKSEAERTVKGWAILWPDGSLRSARASRGDAVALAGSTGCLIVRCTITLHEPKACKARARKATHNGSTR